MSKQTSERIWRKREHCIHYTSHCSVSTSTVSFLSQFAQEMAVEACEIWILHEILIKNKYFPASVYFCPGRAVYQLISLGLLLIILSY